MYSESRFLGLTKTTMELLTNADAAGGHGGVCYFDSGGPVLEHGTQRAVALIAGHGDPGCRAEFDHRGWTFSRRAGSTGSTSSVDHRASRSPTHRLLPPVSSRPQLRFVA